MAYFRVSQNIDVWCSRISCILSLIIILSLLLHQTCKLYQRNSSSQSNNKKRCNAFKLFTSDMENKKVSWSLMLSYVLLIFSIITLIFCILIKWTDSYSWFAIYYKYESFCIAIGYTLSKFSLYILLSYRIEESFINSSYSYDKTFVWLWRIYLFTGVVIFIGSYLFHTKIENQTHTIYPLWLLIYAAIFDFSACLVNLILFTRQLYSFTTDCIDSMSGSSTNHQFIDEFKIIIKKQVLLAIISIISTLLSLITVSIFGIPIFCISFDLFVTNICVVLMFSWNSKYFLFCCKCFVKVISDSVIEGITLSKISTTRLSNIPQHLAHNNRSITSPTPSLTASVTEFSSFPNRVSHKTIQQTLSPPSNKHNNDFSSSFSIDLSSIKHINNMNKIEEDIELASPVPKHKITQKPPVFLKIQIDEHRQSQSMESIGTISRDSIGGNSSSTPNSNQSTPISNQSTPISNSLSVMPTKFPVPIQLNTTLNDVDEDFDSSQSSDDDDIDDDEVP